MLGAAVLTKLLDRTGVSAAAVDGIVFGCVAQVGVQSNNIGRAAWLAAGLPVETPRRPRSHPLSTQSHEPGEGGRAGRKAPREDHRPETGRLRPGPDAGGANPGPAAILKQTGLDLSDIDLFEINEAFASVVQADYAVHAYPL